MTTPAEARDWMIIYNRQLVSAAEQDGTDQQRYIDAVAGNRRGFIRSLSTEVQRQLVEDGYLFEEEVRL